jgi:hypothetical protein
MANRISVVTFIIGIFLGALIYDWFLLPDIETKVEYKTTIKVDTVFVPVKETVYLTKEKIKHEYLRDTIIQDYKPKIQAFKAVFPTSVGNAYLSGEVLGQVLKTSLSTDFKIPVVTNVITNEKTTTNTIIQKGIFLGGGFSNQMDYHVGVAYLGNGFMANVNYTHTPKNLSQPLIQADIKLNLFKIKK